LKEIEDLRRAAGELERRDAVLKAVGFAAERFLGAAGEWEERIGDVLERLGLATGASRVYVFENRLGEDGEIWGSQRHEWVAPSVLAQTDNPLMQAIPYRAAGYGRWIEILGSGEPVHGHPHEFPEDERPELEAQGILSIAIVPISVEGEWWGQIGFDECEREREWSAAEIDALKAAASILGTAIRRRQVEEESRQNEERYRAVIERATDGIYLLDAESKRLIQTNPSFQKMLGYSADELEGMVVYDFVAHPPENVDVTIGRTLEQRRRIVGGREYRRKDGTLLDVEVGVSVISHGDKEVICTIVRDLSERKEAEERLRTSEAGLANAQRIARLGNWEWDLVLNEAYWSDELYRIHGFAPQEIVPDWEEFLRGVHPADRGYVEQSLHEALHERKPYDIEHRMFRRDGSERTVHCRLEVGFDESGRAIRAVGTVHDVTERARAQRLLEERIAALSSVAASLTLDVPMENTLDTLARSVVGASTAGACTVTLIDEKTQTPYLVGSYGLPEGFVADLQAAFRSGAQPPIMEVLRTRQPALVRNLHRLLLKDPLYAPVHHRAAEVALDTGYVVPLVSRDRSVGAINFVYPSEEEPGEDEKAFLVAVADQTAVAVENARLFAKARGKAALEERQRLARELHDSVSQALYGIALEAKTGRALLGGDSQEAADSLEYVLSLAGAGLAEMRALIFELRPESLETEGLVAALEKQVAVLETRHEIGVEAILCDEPAAPLESKEAAYRIAQEAIHNTVRHARAGAILIALDSDETGISLEVSDDGVGFDPEADFPGHLGLSSMRERAVNLGGTLEVDSAPARGTRVRAHIPFR
jgi:PAS domain S-box-containing protein